MRKLVGDEFGSVNWREYAEHSVEGDQEYTLLVTCEPRYASDAWWCRLATWTHVCKPCQRNEHKQCEGNCDCALNNHGRAS